MLRICWLLVLSAQPQMPGRELWLAGFGLGELVRYDGSGRRRRESDVRCSGSLMRSVCMGGTWVTCRRFMWNFIRMENEFVLNCDRVRVELALSKGT